MIRRALFPVLLLGTLSVACATVTEDPIDANAGVGGASTGGSGSGGEGTGGGATGGGATGGGSTGGAGSGGSTGGGASTGGGSTGGSATGGASTGGAATGGASTGGASTGGAATGGASTGGAATGGGGGGLNCSGAVAWVAEQHSVNYPTGQLFTYSGKVYKYEGAAVMTYVNPQCPPDESGEPWCPDQIPWSEVTTCP